MSPPSDRRARGPVAIALLALGIVGVSAAIVHSRGSPEEWEAPARYAGGTPLVELGSVLAEPRLPATLRVDIVHDPASDAFYDGWARLDTLTRRWAEMVRVLGAQARVVSPTALAGSGGADVIVVPSSPCLSAATYEAITTAGRNHGVVLTRHTGLRDGTCTAVGAGLLITATGASRLDTLERRDDAYVVFPAGGPLATDIPPGARMELLAGNHIALRRAGRDAYWSTYALDPAPASGQPLIDAAVVHTERAGARTVYWGFEISDVVEQPWSHAIGRLLVRNSLAWAAGRPLGAIEPWPNGRRVAAVLAQDVEDQFANARHALDTLRAVGVPGTYYLVSELAREHQSLVRALDDHGEIGTHSENHRLLGGLAPDLQRRRLDRTQAQLRDLTGALVAGLRPPEEQFDVATLGAWHAAGGTYVFATNDGRTASPELLLVDDEPMVLLGRVVNDDFAVLRRAGISAPDSQARLYRREYEKLRALGGLYLFSYHSNMLARPELVSALGPLARTLARDTSAWVTTAGEVADWWRARASRRITASWVGGDELIAHVESNGSRPLEGAVLRIDVGGARAAVGSSIGRLLPAEPGVVRVALPRLEPASALEVRVRLAGEAR